MAENLLAIGIEIERRGNQVVVTMTTDEWRVTYEMTPLGCVALVGSAQRFAERMGVSGDSRRQLGGVLTLVLEYARLITEEQIDHEASDASN